MGWFWEVIGGDWIPFGRWVGFVLDKRDPPQSSPAPLTTTRGHSEKSASCNPEEGLTRTWPCQHPDLEPPAPRTVRKKFLLCVSHPQLCDTVLEQPTLRRVTVWFLTQHASSSTEFAFIHTVPLGSGSLPVNRLHHRWFHASWCFERPVYGNLKYFFSKYYHFYFSIHVFLRILSVLSPVDLSWPRHKVSAHRMMGPML